MPIRTPELRIDAISACHASDDSGATDLRTQIGGVIATAAQTNPLKEVLTHKLIKAGYSGSDIIDDVVYMGRLRRHLNSEY